MNDLLPWQHLLKPTVRKYPKPGNGRRPIPPEVMLRIYFLQQGYGLSDPAMEDDLYDVESMRRFAGVDLDHSPNGSLRRLLKHAKGSIPTFLNDFPFSPLIAYDSPLSRLLCQQGDHDDSTLLGELSAATGGAAYRDQVHAVVDELLDALEARMADAKDVPTLWQLTEAVRTERRRLSGALVQPFVERKYGAYLHQQQGRLSRV